MARTTYTTRDEAIEREIIAPIEASGESKTDYDIDGIAAAVIDTNERGEWFCTVDHDEFWGFVADNAR